MNQKTKTEHQEQCSLFAFTRKHSAMIPQLNMLFAIPNGGKRDKMQKIWMWQEGLEAGVLDMMLAVAKQGFHGLFLEMQVKPNKLTDDQKKWKANLEAQGYKCEVAWTSEEAITIILKYLGIKGLI